MIPALQVSYRKDPHAETSRRGTAGWEARSRALAWATGYATSPEPAWEGAWATSMQLWCLQWVITKSYYRPSQLFPTGGHPFSPRQEAWKCLWWWWEEVGRAQQPNFDHLGTCRSEKDAMCAGTGNFQVQKDPHKDLRLPRSGETKVPVAAWTGSKWQTALSGWLMVWILSVFNVGTFLEHLVVSAVFVYSNLSSYCALFWSITLC